jgi:Matrixin
MASFQPSKKVRRSTNSSRLETRRRLEILEKREMLAAEVYPSAIFAPGTPADVVFGGEQFGNPLGASSPLLSGTRWTRTATGIAGSNPGDGATVTWSIVRDGTPLVNANTGANEGTSNLIAFLDGIYGSGGGTTNLTLKPWFKFIADGYNRWANESGLNLVYEPNDDGANHAAGASVGMVGVRGDMRVAGRLIDGNSNVLAFNYFPGAGGNSGSDGDMVIDTGDNFYVNASNGPNGANVGLVNVIAHEVGHGLGLAHTEPVNGTKLMEPFVNTGFLGPQEDDLYDIHELYGDRVEPNDSQAAAHNLSTLRNQTVNFRALSVDNGNDVDLFRFDSPLPTVLTVQLDPTGETYLRGPQGGTPSQVQRIRRVRCLRISIKPVWAPVSRLVRLQFLRQALTSWR